MDLYQTLNTPPPRRRRFRHLKEVGVVLAVIGFLGLYQVPVVQGILDKAINPAVAGITLGYSKLSTVIYKKTGLNFGFVQIPPDPEFLFKVQMAMYANQKLAAPLFNMASDTRLPIEKREQALKTVARFELTEDWIQPFLNELPKGGLLGLYDPEAPLLDQLIRKIRHEGGIRQELVRAYAEVVFGFMLQVPDAIVRQHALRWLSDVIAEEALFMIVPRLGKETDPEVQHSIEQALLDIRAVSNPIEAIEQLTPFYRKPPWPSLRLPIAVVLSRLGHDSSVEYVRYVLKKESFTDDELVTLRIASARTPYPKILKISPKDQSIVQERVAARHRQQQLAWEKYQEIQRQTQIQETRLARAKLEKEEKQQISEMVIEEKEVAAVPTRKKETTVPKKIELAQNVPSIPEERKEIEVKAEPVLSKEIKKEETIVEPPKKPVEKVPPQSFTPTEKKTEEKQVERITVPPIVEPEPAVPPIEVVRVSAQTETPPGKAEEPEPAKEETAALGDQYASLPPGLPEDSLPPPLEMAKPPKSLMNYVDVIFEVKKSQVTLYENPGVDKKTGVQLPVGTKGKADLEVLIGEDRWYQVRTKLGNGWANGSELSVFNLSPQGVEAVAPPETPPQKPLDGDREESTYFQAAGPDVPTYDKPGPKGKQNGVLTEEIPYLAVKSEKVGPDRWFLLQIRSGETAWAEGIFLQLAEVQQPAQMQVPSTGLSQRGKKSSFTAEWVAATVKGVGVYSRPSIAGSMVKQINPPEVYKVLETSEGSGKEWYRIQLPGNKDGWVQTMDVTLTKKK